MSDLMLDSSRASVAEPPRTPLSYIPALDGLRCVAVGLVLVYHAVMPIHIGGNVGVDIFFVLSGYLITSILAAELGQTRTIQLKRFYLRRMIRLYPPLLLCITVMSVPALLTWPSAHEYLAETAAAATYLMPVLHVVAGWDAVWYHMWTLAIEEWFYLVWPIALAFLLRLRLSHRTVGLSIGALGILMLIGKIVLATSGYEFGAYLRAGGLLVGSALALCLHAGHSRATLSWCALFGVGAIVCAVAAGGDITLEPYSYLLAVVGTAALIPSLTQAPTRWSAALSWAPAVWVGQRSYEIYLWHYPVLVLGAQAVGADHNDIWWWAAPLGIALACLSHRVTSPLSSRWKARVPYGKASAVPRRELVPTAIH